MKYELFLTSAVLIFTLSGCGKEQTERIPDEPEADTEFVLELVITDSIGVELGDSNYVFGSIEASSHTAEGNILVLDRPACCVREYTPDGDFVKNFGRRGSGPGEFYNPLSMVRLNDGRVSIFDMQTGMSVFLAEGEWDGITAEIFGEPVMWLTAADSNRYIGTINDFEIIDDQPILTAYVGRFEINETEPSLIYWENSFVFDFSNSSQIVEDAYFAKTWASDRDGNVFLASRDTEEYLITGFDTNGDEFVEISMDLPAVQKSEEEIAEETEFWNQRAKNMGYGGQLNYQPDPYRWKIHSMGIDSQSKLWVRRGTEEIPTFDVFDYEGNHLFAAHIPSIIGADGLLWEVRVDEFGILAWSLNPLDGYQKLYTLELASN
jgi:hypothetical protein